MGKPLEGLASLLQTWSGDKRSRDRCFRRIWEEYYPRLGVFVRSFTDLPASREPFHLRTPEEQLMRGEEDRRVEAFFECAGPSPSSATLSFARQPCSSPRALWSCSRGTCPAKRRCGRR